MKNLYKFLFLPCFLLTFHSTQAQKSDISQYINDGGLSNISNYIAFDFMPLAVGDLGFQYGHKFGKHFAVEGGIGVLLPFYWGSIFDGIDKEYTDATYGFSMLARGKVLFPGRSKTTSPYVDLTLLMRHYGNDHRYFATTSFGYQWTFFERFLMGCGFDVGVAYKTPIDKLKPFSEVIIIDPEPESNFKPAIGLSFRFGYCF